MKLSLDLHIHSEASLDGRMTAEEIVGAALEAGLDGVAVTDHDAFFALPEGYEPPEGFIIIPGTEFSTEYGHLLGIFLKEPVKAKGFRAVAAEIHAQGGLCVMAHPFERTRDPERLLSVIDELDGIETWNGRANRKNPEANAMALRLSRERGLPAFAGSDAHIAREVGNGFVTVEVGEPSLENIKKALLTPGNPTGGREGRDIDVARSQYTALKKRGGGLSKRLKWGLFAAKCLLCDMLRPLRRRK